MGIIFNFLYHKNTDSNPKKLKIDKEIGWKSKSDRANDLVQYCKTL